MGFKARLGRIAGWFQPMANKIDEWDVPWLREMCRWFWNILDKNTQKTIYDFVMAIIKRYGEDKGKEVLDKVLDTLHLKKD